MRDFIILRGWHRAVMFRWHPFFSKRISFETVFNSTVFHDNSLGYVHKLVGFSDGGLNHHKNSFRIAWTADYTENFIRLFAYIYIDGVRNIFPLFNVAPGKKLNFEMVTHKKHYIVVVEGIIYKFPRSTKILTNYKHILYPYFGGKEVAPHTMWLQTNWKIR